MFVGGPELYSKTIDGISLNFSSKDDIVPYFIGWHETMWIPTRNPYDLLSENID